MIRFYLEKKNNSIKKFIMIPFVLGYLLFCTVVLMVSPTTAYFTDSQHVTGRLSASTQFNEKKISDKTEELSDEAVSNDE
ncbi:hypothetical protein [Virgibacillus ndiopensis]|uniref:hypothetical protein n=1 Tax=Virgibacillus ndiopensis TaxID=2004408 RepID=UPI000C088D90|nr:hypothetical protein [Virgibacillus ndiopensis]